MERNHLKKNSFIRNHGLAIQLIMPDQLKASLANNINNDELSKYEKVCQKEGNVPKAKKEAKNYEKKYDKMCQNMRKCVKSGEGVKKLKKQVKVCQKFSMYYKVCRKSLLGRQFL